MESRILICASEGVIALDLQMSLHNMGYQNPVIVSTGEEAIKVARAIDPILVIMEIQLPGELDGIEVARLITRHREVPLIYLSTEFDRTTIKRAKGTHPCGYLIKPFCSSQLEATIAMALDHLGPERPLNCIGSASSDDRTGTRFHSSYPILQELTVIPICSTCKQIRDDSGSWNPLEEYFTEHFGIRFTHGLCTACSKNFHTV